MDNYMIPFRATALKYIQMVIYCCKSMKTTVTLSPTATKPCLSIHTGDDSSYDSTKINYHTITFFPENKESF